MKVVDMAVPSNAAPVIIKKKKIISAEGHHGGAWKVAYADFVTAMMAFFMLMWLLNATTEKQRKGLADYFSPTLPITRISGGGDGVLGGESVFSEDIMAQNGTGGMQLRPGAALQLPQPPGESPEKRHEDRQFKAVKDKLIGGGGESLIADNALKHVVTKVTDEGLIIELFDLETIPLFEPNSDRATPVLKDLLGLISDVAEMVINPVAIEAHTRAKPLVLAHDPNWELSADRANRVRRLLQGAGFAHNRIHRVTGHSDRELVASDPMAVRNNRIEIILLRRDI